VSILSRTHRYVSCPSIKHRAVYVTPPKYVARKFIPWSRVQLEKLTGPHLVQKLPVFYGHAIWNVRHLTLTCARSIQSIPSPTHFLKIYFSSIPLSTPAYSKWSPSLRFPVQNPVRTSPFPIRATCPTHLILLNLTTRIIFGEEYRSLNYTLCSFLHSLVISPS